MLTIHYTAPVLTLETDKFKDFILSVKYLFPNREPEVTMANLLAYLWTDRTHLYPTKLRMNEQMDDLYGLSLDTKTSAFGQSACLELRIKTLNPRYAQSGLIRDAQAFFDEVLDHPLIDAETFDEARINLRSALLRIQDNPTYFGLIQAAQGIGQGQPLGTFSQGNLEILEQLTLEQVAKFHEDLLTQKPLVLFSGESEALANADFTRFKSGSPYLHPSAYTFETDGNFHKILERDIEQTTLTQLYLSQTLYGSRQYIAMRLMVAMLGQLPSSLLFREVREKRSLCYSIYTSSMNFDGIMSLQTGIAYENLEAVKDLIELQIWKLRTGAFSEKLLTVAKKMMLSSMESIQDDRSAYFNYLTQRLLTAHSLEVTEILEQIRSVTKSDIQAAAGQLRLVSEVVQKGNR